MNLRRLSAIAVLGAGTLGQANALTLVESPAAIRAIIDNAIQTGPDSKQRALAELRLLDQSSVPALVEVFSGRDLRELENQVIARDGKFDVPPPPPWLQEVLLAALEKQDGEHVERALSRFALKANLDERLLCLQIAERMKGNRAVDSWVALLADVPPIRLRSTFVAGPAERSLATIMSETPRAIMRVSKRLNDIDPFLHPTIARSVSSSPPIEALTLLSDLTGESDELDLIAIREAGRLSIWGANEIPEARFQFLTRALRSTDPRYRAEATVALARLRYTAEIDSMLAALDDIDRSTANAAHWALKHLSGLDWAPNSERWSAWWAAEQKWFKDRFDALTLQVRSAEPSARLSALDELSTHRVHAGRILAVLETLILTGDPVFDERTAIVAESLRR